jgi:hypothetical protein
MWYGFLNDELYTLSDREQIQKLFDDSIKLTLLRLLEARSGISLWGRTMCVEHTSLY